jgi:hypothetical protein
MTDCSEHFCEDLPGVDRVVGVVYFVDTLVAILLTFGLMEAFGLMLMNK